MRVSGEGGGERVYSLPAVRAVRIEYTSQERKNIIGGVTLVALSAPFVVSGVFCMMLGATNPEISSGVGTALEIAGVVTLANGIGMVIPGIVLLVREPGDPRATAPISTSLHVGPDGASLRGTF
jgi:hypothetical protein